MIKTAKRPSRLFVALLVEPTDRFQPTNWQQTPMQYRVIEQVGTQAFKGRVDAWKFMHNHDAMNDGDSTGRSPKTWAIYRRWTRESSGVNLDSVAECSCGMIS